LIKDGLCTGSSLVSLGTGWQQRATQTPRALQHPKPARSRAGALPRLLPDLTSSAPGLGMAIQEGLLGKDGSSLGLYTFDLHKSGLWKDTVSLNPKALCPSTYSPLLAPAYALVWLRGGLSWRNSSSRTAVVFRRASPQLTVLTCRYLCCHDERHGAGKGTSLGLQDCRSQQQYRLKACIEPWPQAIPISGLCSSQ